MFRQLPPPPGHPAPMFGRPIKGGAGTMETFKRDQAGLDSQTRVDNLERYIKSLSEMDIVTADGTKVTVLVRRPGGQEDTTETGTQPPWHIVRLTGRGMRIYPSAIWDGAGHSIWASYEGNPSIAEGFFDITLPGTPLHGFVWLECTVDDTDDDHGILLSAEIKAGTEVAFNARDGPKVNIALATYFLTPATGSYTFDPVRAFVFCLRRFGPRTSITWDVEPL